jgi:hypothetical protein
MRLAPGQKNTARYHKKDGTGTALPATNLEGQYNTIQILLKIF